MKWNTQKVVDDLIHIDLVTSVNAHPPGGDHDSETVTVEVKGCEDILHVCAFDPEKDTTNPSDEDFDFIQLTDGMDSRGGLNSHEENLGLVYLKVRKYFHDAGFDVVATLDDYF